MQQRRLILIAAALALFATYIVRSWVESARQEASATVPVQAPPPPRPATMVLVAAHEMPSGHFVVPADLSWQSWPDDNVQKNYIVGGAGQTQTNDDLIGAVVRIGLAAGEPITEGRIIKRGDRSFLAAVMTPGYRAITVPMSGNTALTGLVMSGDRVDIIVTMQVPGEGKDSGHHISETVLQDIRVLAVDQKVDDMQNPNIQARTATLEVTPQQAETVALMAEIGKISLTLRSIGGNDHEISAPHVTWDSDTNSFLGKPRAAGGDASFDTEKVSIVRGTTATEIEFPRGAK
jgi:pilus assembly protein CpaB